MIINIIRIFNKINIGYNALFAYINASAYFLIVCLRMSLVFLRHVVLSGLPTDNARAIFYRINTNDLNIRIVNNFCARHHKQSRFFLRG